MTVMTNTAGPGLETGELRDALDTVISIPVVPFRNGEVDFEGHATNVDYLMNTNNLEGDRRRAIAIAGTSLVHHISLENQVRLMEIAGERMSGRGVLMAGIAPNPLPDAARLIEAMSGIEYPPDVYLVMPLTGIVQPAGLYGTYMEFAERAGECGARLLYYLRSPEQIPYVARLVNDSHHFIGVKVGTRDEDVAPLAEQIDRRRGMVIWGIGDPLDPRRRARCDRAHFGHQHRLLQGLRRDQQRPAPGRLRGLPEGRGRAGGPGGDPLPRRAHVQLLSSRRGDACRRLAGRGGRRRRAVQSPGSHRSGRGSEGGHRRNPALSLRDRGAVPYGFTRRPARDGAGGSGEVRFAGAGGKQTESVEKGAGQAVERGSGLVRCVRRGGRDTPSIRPGRDRAWRHCIPGSRAPRCFWSKSPPRTTGTT